MFKLLTWLLLLNRLVDLNEIFYGEDDTEGDLDSILLNPVASTIPKWRTSEMGATFELIGGFG
jgi:hypothetical protein